jgi:hypothetical protein
MAKDISPKVALFLAACTDSSSKFSLPLEEALVMASKAASTSF